MKVTQGKSADGLEQKKLLDMVMQTFLARRILLVAIKM